MSKDRIFLDADSYETKKRDREIKLLINVIEPDPEYQPIFISDLASFYDVTAQNEELIKLRLEFYLNRELPAPLITPLWKFVDILKERYPGWPEEWPVKN